MIRKLSLAVAVAAALSPLGVFALGLGEIHTHSALNQLFKADIDLLSTTQEELQDVKIGLASQEAFTKAGIDRPFLLTGLKFTPSTTPDGRPVIAISSRDPIREPFLNFMIEVNWPKGRLIREYTVLLDPPVTLDRRPAAVQTPRVAATPAREYAPVARPTATPISGNASPAASSVGGERTYGPIQTNDNLWQIARSLRQGDESVEQVMLALLRYNPDAFIRNNVNLLKAGKILRLPEGADVTAISRREARKEFLAQTRDWRQEQEQLPTSLSSAAQESSSQTPGQTEQEMADRLELVATKSAEGEESLDQEGKAERSDDVTRLEKQMLITKEENASVRLENKALQSKVVELEAQLEDMQRLLTLKNDQMTELQTTQRIVAQQTESKETPTQQPLEQASDQPETTAITTASEEVAKAVASADEGAIKQIDIEQVIADASQAEQATPSLASVTEPAVAGTQTVVAKTEETKPVEAIEQAPVSAAGGPAEAVPIPAAKVNKPAPPPTVAAPEPMDFLDSLLGNTTLMSLSGGVALLLLILLGLIMRRRKEAEAEFAESILVTPDGEAVATAGRGSVAAINESSEETSFMSDFSPSDIDALQDETGEVDPISEADVYIAYGRYQQAEELIKQAIERFPEREELKHKLLEIYYSARNEAKYSSLAEELQQAGLEQQKPDIWAKVVAMGRELNPSNVLFTSAAGLTAGLGLSDDDPLDDLGLNLDSGLSGNMFKTPADVAVASPELEDEMDSLDLSGLTGGHENDSDNFDVDLSLDSEFLNSLGDFEAEAPGQRKQVDSLDFGAGDLGTTVERSQQAANEDDLALVSSLDGLSELSEFQIEDADRDSFVADDDNIVGIENSESLEDLDLESLEKELELLSGDLRGNNDFQQKKRTDTARDELDLSDGLETQSSELNLSDELEIPSEEMDLNATDEVTTKLDLARAYVDMGDAEGAKSILEEVVTEGSDDQRQQARELLEELTA